LALAALFIKFLVEEKYKRLAGGDQPAKCVLVTGEKLYERLEDQINFSADSLSWRLCV
jgi:hypothetical protein